MQYNPICCKASHKDFMVVLVSMVFAIKKCHFTVKRLHSFAKML